MSHLSYIYNISAISNQSMRNSFYILQKFMQKSPVNNVTNCIFQFGLYKFPKIKHVLIVFKKLNINPKKYKGKEIYTVV